jgi:glycosyltransferase involved in cell wall biosynthesis
MFRHKPSVAAESPGMPEMPDPVPRVSVLMTTYNGAAFIRQSIDSVLGQSFGDFELIVVDDCSTDTTPAILATFADPRLRVVRNPRNLGVVAARNRGIAAVRGSYVAALDHDDVSCPGRLAAQVEYLDRNKRVVLVGTGTMINDNGKLYRTETRGAATPGLMRWMLHVGTPLAYSSVMFRAAAVRQLGSFMREECELADDFDLYHRLLSLGEIARLDETLTIYRLHATNTSLTAGGKLFDSAVKILAAVYRDWLAEEAEQAASLVIRHFSERTPARDATTLERLGDYLERLLAAFLATYPQTPADQTLIRRQASAAWWGAVRAAVRSGHPWLAPRFLKRRGLSGHYQPSLLDRGSSLAIGILRAPRHLGGR